jgi:predicted HNH restriction endonuclease
MSNYAVLVQNDESKWDDIKGELYHYPNIYRSILTPGCKIIYYKGRMTNPAFVGHRLSAEAHYFGIGVIGTSIIDSESHRKDHYCEILDYREFEEAVPMKVGKEYLEPIPDSKKSNYWRFGVREITKMTYERILGNAKTKGYEPSLPSPHQELESFQPIEGGKKARFSAYYERNPFYRNRAIEIHGVTCMACGFNFRDHDGELGNGFINVHHNKPISETGPTRINPQTDLSVLCANCHAMIHRNKNQTLSVGELRDLMLSRVRKSCRTFEDC